MAESVLKVFLWSGINWPSVWVQPFGVSILNNSLDLNCISLCQLYLGVDACLLGVQVMRMYFMPKN